MAKHTQNESEKNGAEGLKMPGSAEAKMSGSAEAKMSGSAGAKMPESAGAKMPGSAFGRISGADGDAAKKGLTKRQKKEIRNRKIRSILAWVLAVLLVLGMLTPLLAVFGESDSGKAGNSSEQKGVRANAPSYESLYAVVLEVTNESDAKNSGGAGGDGRTGGGQAKWTAANVRVPQILKVRVTSPGPYNGLVIDAEYERNAYFNEKYLLSELKAGDKVVLHAEKDKYGAISKAYVADVDRHNTLIWLVGVFFAGLLLVGGLKGGLKAIFSLLLTGVMVFFVFIPLILKGYNAVILSIAVCIVVITLSFLIISGFRRKTLAATAGTAVGIVIAGVLFLVFSAIMKITGVADEHAKMLIFSAHTVAIDLKGLLFAGVLIASMGASMDIGMTVASTVNEVEANSPGITKFALFKAGLNVGRDAMATMANTLILAYTGTSLNLILLLSLNNIKPIVFLNWEILAIEITRALTATIGLLSAIPVTAYIAAELFDKKARR